MNRSIACGVPPTEWRTQNSAHKGNGPRGQLAGEACAEYVAALDVTFGNEVYSRLGAASQIDLGEPCNQLAQNPGGSLGG